MTINGSSIEDNMSTAMVQATVNDGPASEKVGRAGVQQEDQRVQQSHASAMQLPAQRSTPGRRPLFHN